MYLVEEDTHARALVELVKDQNVIEISVRGQDSRQVCDICHGLIYYMKKLSQAFAVVN